MDKIQQLKTWLEDTIKHGGNNQHTLSGVLQKIDEIYEWDKCVLAKAREIEAESIPLPEEKPVWTPTKNEEIEVSEDGVRWVNRFFKRMEDNIFRCSFIRYGKGSVRWTYTRPLTVENEEIKRIELPPDYTSPTFSPLLATQVEALTKSLREVIEVEYIDYIERFIKATNGGYIEFDDIMWLKQGKVEIK